MKNTIAGVCFLSMLSLCTSCNNDLFIDEFLKQDVSQTVSCGDSAVVRFDGSNWDVLTVGYTQSTHFSVKAYDSEGNKLTEYAQYGYPGMARIEAENEYNYFEIKRNSERELKIRPLEMLHDKPFLLDILVGNDYEQRVLQFTIHPSPKYQVDSIAYHWDTFKTQDAEVKMVNSIHFSNNGSIPQTYKAYPYKNGVNRTFQFYWNQYSTRLQHLHTEQPVTVPDVENGKAVLRNTQIPVGENGKNIELPLDSFDPNLSVPVVINPHENCSVITYHEIESYNVSCTLYTSHPISHRKNVYKGTLYSSRPYGHLVIKQKDNQHE